MNNTFNNLLNEIFMTIERMVDDAEYLIARNTLLSLLEDEPGFAKAHNLLGWLYMYHLDNEPWLKNTFFGQ